MCGITGFVDWNKKSSEEMLNQMNKMLNHRVADSADLHFLFHIYLKNKVFNDKFLL